MKINLTSVPVEDQAKALNFYTEKLGFSKKEDVAMGEYRWLTITAPQGTQDVEVLLEPLGFAPAKTFQKELYEAGIPFTSFGTDNMDIEVQRLKENGVVFKSEPKVMGDVKAAMFDDTCGNIICLTQKL
ncbi:MAG: VOC family protein [Pseudomonadota bacterium]